MRRPLPVPCCRSLEGQDSSPTPYRLHPGGRAPVRTRSRLRARSNYLDASRPVQHVVGTLEGPICKAPSHTAQRGVAVERGSRPGGCQTHAGLPLATARVESFAGAAPPVRHPAGEPPARIEVPVGRVRRPHGYPCGPGPVRYAVLACQVEIPLHEEGLRRGPSARRRGSRDGRECNALPPSEAAYCEVRGSR